MGRVLEIHETRQGFVIVKVLGCIPNLIFMAYDGVRIFNFLKKHSKCWFHKLLVSSDQSTIEKFSCDFNYCQVNILIP